jgi:hypothetical protein
VHLSFIYTAVVTAELNTLQYSNYNLVETYRFFKIILPTTLSVWQTSLAFIIFQQNISYSKDNTETFELIPAERVRCHSKTPFRITSKRTKTFILHNGLMSDYEEVLNDFVKEVITRSL